MAFWLSPGPRALARRCGACFPEKPREEKPGKRRWDAFRAGVLLAFVLLFLQLLQAALHIGGVVVLFEEVLGEVGNLHAAHHMGGTPGRLGVGGGAGGLLPRRLGSGGAFRRARGRPGSLPLGSCRGPGSRRLPLRGGTLGSGRRAGPGRGGNPGLGLLAGLGRPGPPGLPLGGHLLGSLPPLGGGGSLPRCRCRGGRTAHPRLGSRGLPGRRGALGRGLRLLGHRAGAVIHGGR